ncbi:MAG: hypothetical protein ACREJU_18985, partial [Nitrospiraceae bacterium]
MTSAIPSWNALPDTPVFGATQFTGRTRLAQNLLTRCLRRQSILLYGGPKLGKTSMLLHLKWLLDQAREASSAAPAAVYLDLTDEVARKQLLFGRWANPAPILLLDNCDRLLTRDCVSALREFMKSEALAHASGWTGARAWHDWVLDQLGTTDLRRAPLTVLLEGAARELLKPRLAADHITAALAAGGTHPYVLKVIAHVLRPRSGDPGRAIQTAAERLVPFFRQHPGHADGMGELEHHFIHQLIVANGSRDGDHFR